MIKDFGEGKHFEEELLPAYRDTLKREHEYISHRMGWLMTLNGFLVAGAALLAANYFRFNGTNYLTWALLAISFLGAVSNSSCLFSNYWAMRAIEGAGDVLIRSWGNLDLGSRVRLISRMRLYGRDPESFGVNNDKSPPSKWLHPWFLLPVSFIAAYVILPFIPILLRGTIGLGDIVFLIPSAVILLIFLIGVILDIRHKKNRKNGTKMQRQRQAGLR